ncbi:MAG TPA: Dyp-type peroxidase [Pseudonocardiaceae bacterium]|jgi:putative iron-dependent peroxidase|nr:Dyp-type peroxidase [Pseudonocardiaceae bacterium]
MTSNAAQPLAPQPQAVAGGLTRNAIFLVLTINPGADSVAAVRGLCGDLAGLVRAVGFRDIEADLNCVIGFGTQSWTELAGAPLPAQLHPFRELRAGNRHAVATPGDLLLHIRSARMDLCFELATHITTRLGAAVSPADEVHGFRYFDDRDLIGFVDGTENPVGADAVATTVIGDEDPMFAGGSYVIVQKYLHDLTGWNQLSTEDQEGIVGRRKLSDIELDDEDKPSYAHNVLTSIEEDGEELEILRDNMPFGNPSRGEYGTYFIGYARAASTIELMLENMFIGKPPGNYDRLLDFSTAVTGNLFFVPSQPLLESLAEDPSSTDVGSVEASEEPDSSDDAQRAPGSLGTGPLNTGSLNIGSLRGTAAHE